MRYKTSKEKSIEWGLSDRSIRNYCQNGRIKGAYLEGKIWMIPSKATKPERAKRSSSSSSLLDILKREKDNHIKGGIYHQIQIEMAYNSNHIEGSKLTEDETRYIYETNTIGINNKAINVDDIIETVNHFKCFDFIIDQANKKLSESLIKELHRILKCNTSVSRESWFKVGDYKLLENVVGGKETTPPSEVKSSMKELLSSYNKKEKHTLEDIVAFHVILEKIHPFQDGNGRVGRLIMFKECLKNNIIPFIIYDSEKMFYYRGLKEYTRDKEYLLDTCRHSQDRMRKLITFKKWFKY